ncbi:MAG: CARDB domain-containing protein [Methanobacterium sp.]
MTTETTVTTAPDLTPTTITTPTEPIYTGLPYTIKTTIANIGDAAAQNILVRLYDNNNLIGTQTITNLTIGATTTLNFDWTPTFGTTGLHTLQTIIDPLNTINEHNETNNDITTLQPSPEDQTSHPQQ